LAIRRSRITCLPPDCAQACYGLEFVEILDNLPAGYSHLKQENQRAKNFRVNLINARKGFRGNLMRHPRNIAPKVRP
jgi:hypothetical protein